MLRRFFPHLNNFVLNFPEGINGEEVVVWVDVTELFKKRTSGAKITAEFTPPEYEG